MNKSFVTDSANIAEPYAGVIHASVTIKNMQATNIQEEQYRHYSIFLKIFQNPNMLRVWIGGWRHVEHLDPTKAHTGRITLRSICSTGWFF